MPEAPAVSARSWRGLLARPWLVAGLSALIMFVIAASWSLATPVAGGPDESGQIMKAAASARGIWLGTPTGKAGIQSFELPGNVADVGAPFTCFAFRPDLSAACAPNLSARSSAPARVESGVGSYNPSYYFAVGLPSLFLHGTAGIYAMRLVSGALGAIFLSSLFFALTVYRRARPMLGAAIAAALAPMTLYLNSVINPSGLEDAALIAFAVGLWCALDLGLTVRVRSQSFVIAAVAGAVVANLRATSIAYLAIVLIGVLIFRGVRPLLPLYRQRWVPVATGGALVAGLLGVVWTLRYALGAGYIPSSGHERDGVLAAAVKTLGMTPTYLNQAIGDFGWLDTLPPASVYLVFTLLVGAVTLAALALSQGRARLMMWFLVAVDVLLPVVLQAPTAHEYGYIWQGRYSLPLYAITFVIAGLLLARREQSRWPSAGAITVLGWLIAAAASVACYVYAARRYGVGTVQPVHNLFAHPLWTPSHLSWPLLIAVFTIGWLLLGALGVLIGRRGADR